MAAQAINDRLRKLRSLPDDTRARVTKELALEIRQLPEGSKLGLASALANLATEGDFGRDTLQAVTATLEAACARAARSPIPRSTNWPAWPDMKACRLV